MLTELSETAVVIILLNFFIDSIFVCYSHFIPSSVWTKIGVKMQVWMIEFDANFYLLFYYIEIIAIVSLLNDQLAWGDLTFEHGVQNFTKILLWG